ncbi:hypothetical protein CVIRNUC_010803 [Coccomyxa viridis]|uniref:NADP-dependent oxidoreductase domain-containing protein n=1 Tax=Coccomyxa viridis TaxID=1274662 RepID=A0AAV1ILR7_9CHLO|nr:hypothetical protein CVIRNUC_010803 [Coccomyxa viridis]
MLQMCSLPRGQETFGRHAALLHYQHRIPRPHHAHRIHCELPDSRSGEVSRRDVVMAGAMGAAGSQLAASASPAAAAQDTVSPVNIKAKETMQLGKSGLTVSPVGIGAWSWGDRTGYWGYGGDYQREDNLTAYQAIVDEGITFIDTAEVYGFGLSEQFLGEFMRETSTRPIIATKYAPLPWRFTSGAVVSACRASLQRLGIQKAGLYMQHWPGFVTNGWCNDAFVEGLGDCALQGLTQAVGVSNFTAERVRHASSILEAKGVPLASNQVQYSLLYREPERNGVKKAIEDVGATLVAYSPLNQGLLTGKYTETNLPKGPRGAVINADRVREVQPLLSLMRDIASAHGGKTPGQVAINWTLCKGALPIPGAKNARQVKEAAGALGWRMSPDQVAALDSASAKISTSLGAPFEKW